MFLIPRYCTHRKAFQLLLKESYGIKQAERTFYYIQTWNQDMVFAIRKGHINYVGSLQLTDLRRRYLSILQNMHQFLLQNTLSSPSCNQYKMRLPGSSTIRFSLYVFSLQIKSVACLFWSPVCSPGRYRYLYRPSPGNTFSSGYV